MGKRWEARPDGSTGRISERIRETRTRTRPEAGGRCRAVVQAGMPQPVSVPRRQALARAMPCHLTRPAPRACHQPTTEFDRGACYAVTGAGRTEGAPSPWHGTRRHDDASAGSACGWIVVQTPCKEERRRPGPAAFKQARAVSFRIFYRGEALITATSTTTSYVNCGCLLKEQRKLLWICCATH
jgi:hypothetical protein